VDHDHEHEEEECGEQCHDHKVYVLKKREMDLIKILEETENLSVFVQTSVLDLIEFKWNSYAMNWHLVGLIMHFIYMGTVSYFVFKLYVQDKDEWKYWCLTIMSLGIVYPLIYDSY